MASITLRSVKGSALTFQEGDDNFSNLNNDKIELTDLSVSTGAIGETAALSYNNTTGEFTFTPVDTSDLIALTDLSVGTEGAASGDGAISYNNTTGVFTYTPPDLSSYLTSYTETDPVVGAITGIVKADGAGNISAATANTDYIVSSNAGTTGQVLTKTASGVEFADAAGGGTTLSIATSRASNTLYVSGSVHAVNYISSQTSDPDNIVTFGTGSDAGKFTLQAGTYLIQYVGSFYISDTGTAKFENLTDSSIEVYMSGNTSASPKEINPFAILRTITSAKTYRVNFESSSSSSITGNPSLIIMKLS